MTDYPFYDFNFPCPECGEVTDSISTKFCQDGTVSFCCPCVNGLCEVNVFFANVPFDSLMKQCAERDGVTSFDDVDWDKVPRQ